MSLRLRFLLSLLAVLVLLAAPALFAAGRVTRLRDVVLELRGQAAQSAFAVGRLDAALEEFDRHQRVFVATADTTGAAAMHETATEIASALATLRSAGYRDAVAAAAIDLDSIRAAATRIQALVRQGQLQDATDFLLADAAPRVERARRTLPALAAAIDLNTGERVSLAQRSAVAAATTTTAAVLVGAALAIALALAAARVLTRPLDRLRRAMANVADGSFEAPDGLPYDRRDEVGDLSRSFRTMTLRLAELDRLKAEFVGSVSHDLKTPISVISGYAELIQDELGGTLSPRQEELLRSLAEQMHALQRRVDQLLEISRMESGRVRLGLEQINLRHFLAEVRREHLPAATAHELRLELSVHERTPAELLADPDVLRSDVLANLLTNAIRFTPAGGQVRITARADGDRLSIEVADTGLGIPQERLEHLFDRYYRRGSTTGGTGLGLAIARAGVESHGGRIEVRSRVGRGTQFRITLPLRGTATPATDGWLRVYA